MAAYNFFVIKRLIRYKEGLKKERLVLFHKDVGGVGMGYRS